MQRKSREEFLKMKASGCIDPEKMFSVFKKDLVALSFWERCYGILMLPMRISLRIYRELQKVKQKEE